MMNPITQRISVALALLFGLLLASPGMAGEPPLRGAGATFPAQVYDQWAELYAKERGTPIHYEGIGSSGGVKLTLAHQVDFGATDVPLSNEQLKKHGLVQFPTLVGGVVPVVQLPGVASGRLRLTAEVLGAIFAGQIGHWNDPAIAALNPGLHLPGLPITRVVRADGSGTTTVFVEYLRKTAPQAAAAIEFKDGIAKWPGSQVKAEDGTSKVVAAVKATPGAIGYVSSDYVLRDRLTAVSLRNKHGDFVTPTLESFRAAVRASGLFRDSLEAPPLLDLDGPLVWPIVTATYIVVDKKPASVERAARTLNFFYRSFLLGDRAVAGTGFAPLPVETQARIVSLLTSFRGPDGKALPVMSGNAPLTQVGLR